MTRHRSALCVAAVLAGVAAVVPVAGAGSGDVQSIRTAAVGYETATLNGSPKACQMATPFESQSLVAFAWMDAHTKVAGCPAAVKVLAKFYASKFPNHQAYLRVGGLRLKAIARGKVKIAGSEATLDYTVAESQAIDLSYDLSLVHGRWLINGGTETPVSP
jgi:hypothetical protein